MERQRRMSLAGKAGTGNYCQVQMCADVRCWHEHVLGTSGEGQVEVFNFVVAFTPS